MITIFNRRELILTWDMKKQADARAILRANNIDYTVKVTNPQTSNFFGSTSRSRVGSFGINSDFSYEYKIYVKKSDYEQATYLIGKI